MRFALTWAAPPVPGRTLFLVFAYHGRDRDTGRAGPIERFEGGDAYGHRITHRDHYANPRTLEYQMAMVASAVEMLSPEAPATVVVDAAFGDAAGRFASVADLARPELWRDSPAAHGRHYDNVVAVYADALGLGCERAEARLVRESGSILVLNGRRRVFRLDASLAHRLDVSRFLASTRIVERTLAVAVRPFAAALALFDLMTGRRA